MNITITGNLGAGKSSVCAYLKQQGFEVISTGSIFREIAEKRGLSVLEMNEAVKTDPSIDSLIDRRSVELGKEKDHAVFDSRMAWHFIPNSFKVFLLVDTNEAARRVLADHTRETEKYATIEEAAEKLQERAFLEKNRFQELYGVNYFAIHNYNLVVDSTDVSPEQVAQEIIRNYNLFQKDPFLGKVELCISNLYPTQTIKDFNSSRFNEYYQLEKNNTENICAMTSIPVMSQNGYFYIIDGHHRTFAAARAEKKFTEVTINKDDQKTIMPLSNTSLYDFEDIGQFQYRYYPEKTPKRDGYLFDFIENEDRQIQEEDQQNNLDEIDYP